jgi:hypothetical protein
MSIGFVVLLALAELGSKFVFLKALNPTCGLSLQVLKTQEPC